MRIETRADSAYVNTQSAERVRHFTVKAEHLGIVYCEEIPVFSVYFSFAAQSAAGDMDKVDRLHYWVTPDSRSFYISTFLKNLFTVSGNERSTAANRYSRTACAYQRVCLQKYFSCSAGGP
jgi:hypothetical protein